MAITLNGTTGITTPDITSEAGLTVDGVSFASGAPANTLVTTSGGNVGVGTNSPTEALQIYRSSGDPAFRIQSSAGNCYVVNRSGTSAMDLLNSMNGAMTFATNNSERARITSSGNLLVGNTTSPENARLFSASNTSTTAAPLVLHNTATGTNSLNIAVFYRNSGSTGAISTTNNTTAYNTSSDYRLKENIQPMTGALAKVAALKPCTYTWKDGGMAGEGFIAHELQAVCPDAVTGEKDAVNADGNPVYQGIDTSFLVATLTAAIQEQQELITAQQTALQDALGKIETLEARVAALEAA